jgi:peptidoglycan/LPS O-acetylase OafA/YrhL
VAAVAISGLLLIQLGRGLNGFTLPGVVVGLSLVGGLSAALLVATLAAAPGSPLHRLFTHPVLRFFGRYSYGMYLLHMPVRNLVRGWLFPGGAPLTTAGATLFGQQALFAVVATLVLCLVAVAVYHGLERPFLALKRFVPRPQPPAPSNSPS